MIGDTIKTMGILIAAMGIIACFIDSDVGSVAIVIGSLGWVMAVIAVPIKFDDNTARRNRGWIADDLAMWGYCPKGYSGRFDPARITTRCKGAGYDKCKACIQLKMGDVPTKRIISIKEHDALQGEEHGSKKE